MSTLPEAKQAPTRPAPTKPAPWAFAAPWGARGYVSDLDGPVHWIEFGDKDASGRDGTPIVFVHGLGGSHLNWCLIGPRLEMMASVRVPVLLLGGEADRLVPVASMREAAAGNPGWETVILPGVGHTPQLEVPDSVTGTLRDWLRTHF
jgi:pimeloyl-ACP methyl ester carboxylesterase